MHNPIKVGITHGDINGVGYEVIIKSIGEEGITDLFTPVIFGYSSIAEKAKEEFDYPNLKFNVVQSASEIKPGLINIVELKGEKPDLVPGKIDKKAGLSAVLALETAIEALKRGEIDVLVTAPISKEAVQSDVFHFPGHTEFLTSRIGEGNEALMILCDDNLKVALLTVHLPITKIGENITEERIITSTKIFSKTLQKDFGIVRPTIAVLSLNPHAGDGGVLGMEEEEIIKPAISKLKEEGIMAFGPFAADGFFGHSSYKNYDGVLAMYHDQGLAPFKTVAINGGINYSANLPYIRTSPDHGTAYDIAWQGKADAKSMREAIYMAIDIFRSRKNYEESSSNPLKKYIQERPERFERHERFPQRTETDLIPDSDD